MNAFLNPASVLLVGVTRQTGVGAYNNLEVMRRYGYKGPIFVVHPSAKEILGHPCYGSVSHVPQVPELAVVSVGRDRVLPVVRDCLHKGIRNLVIISQGFADADDTGRALQEELVRLSRQGGARVLGPNTMGILNAFDGFSTAFIDIPRDPCPPPLTLVAQSGVLQVGIESFTGRLGKAIDIGNGCDIHFVDALQYCAQDPQTEIIVLHMEGMRNGRRFLDIAASISAHKPIIVLKTGRSQAGARAALSHTGSLVGEDAVFDAAFQKAGLLRVRSMVELRAVAKAFLHFRPMAGPNLAVLTATGACGIMSADACEDFGLQLAPFPEEAREGLENPKIPWHRLGNPVDLWPLGMVGGSFPHVLEKAATALVARQDTHATLAIFPRMSSPLHDNLRFEDVLRRVQEKNVSQKPLACWVYGDGAEEESRVLDRIPGVACFPSLDEAVMGLAATYRFAQWRQKMAIKASAPEPPKVSTAHGSTTPRTQGHEELGPAMGKNLEDRITGPNGVVLGDEALGWLARFGISTVPSTVVTNADGAVRWAKENGFPVVLKVVSPQWVHKSDAGGVMTDLGDAEAVRRAFEKLLERFRATTPQGHLDGIQVQKQISGWEMLLGLKRDPQFGPLVVVGQGGLYAEVFKDVQRALAPVSADEARLMISSLRLFPVLQGVRGRPPADLKALVNAVVRLSDLAWHHEEIQELDINPLFVSDKGCWAVDCRMVIE
ncbi:acetate--CoA ligase family protein [Desulfosoma caldarium]|uniref:Acetyltransferase n=1 Tax=Desulfosoma caldarium TaxID=610254 RepID=A0A3N1V1V3_9BACT|nr:acetate--CoA ligase family protein [Desulfosoma caldarium]ROQ93476.1 acetyltransferase [Desulfosoma caldarium]